MCTVTIIRESSGAVRMVTSRDESPRRAPALPPRWHTLGGGGRAVWPVDPTGGGTWVAAADTGLALTILNCNPRTPPSLPPRDDLVSRGTIIPALIDSGSASAVMQRLANLDLQRYGPFRLIALDTRDAMPTIIESRWDYQTLAVVEHAGAPVCFASSGLGDHRVEPRLDLFERMVVAVGATPERQDAFHRHRWDDRPEISVLMHRPEARTVSICAMRLAPAVGEQVSINATYTPIDASVAQRPAAVQPEVQVGQPRAHSAQRP